MIVVRVNYLLAHFFIAILTRITHLAFGRTHVLLELGLADVREAEGKQRLPGSDVQHVVLLAEQQGSVIEDTVHRESLGRPLLCIWEKAGDHHIAGQNRGEQTGTVHTLMLEVQEHTQIVPRFQRSQ